VAALFSPFYTPPLADLMTISFRLNSSMSYISFFPPHFLSPLLFPFHYTLPLHLCKTPSHPPDSSIFSPATDHAQAVQAPLHTSFSLHCRADSSSRLSLAALTTWCLMFANSQRDHMGPGKIRNGVRRKSVSVLGDKLHRRELRRVV